MGPVGPVHPVDPVGPVGPVGPVDPVGPSKSPSSIISPIYVNALEPGKNGFPDRSTPYPSAYTNPSLGPVVPFDFTNMNKFPPRINTILPTSTVPTSPRPANLPGGSFFVNSVISPSKNSDSVLKNPATTNPVPGEPVIPVGPRGPI